MAKTLLFKTKEIDEVLSDAKDLKSKTGQNGITELSFFECVQIILKQEENRLLLNNLLENIKF